MRQNSNSLLIKSLIHVLTDSLCFRNKVKRNNCFCLIFQFYNCRAWIFFNLCSSGKNSQPFRRGRITGRRMGHYRNGMSCHRMPLRLSPLQYSWRLLATLSEVPYEAVPLFHYPGCRHKKTKKCPTLGVMFGNSIQSSLSVFIKKRWWMPNMWTQKDSEDRDQGYTKK